MSARRRRLTFKPRARSDVKDVLTYTREQWGTEQRRRYKSVLDRAFRELIDFPESGRTRDELYAGCRVRAVEQHVVYYHLTETEIVVTRVLHARQDPAGKVEP
jgi:toxin ParE1/3/4